MNPAGAIAVVVNFVEEGLIDFGRNNGYSAVLMAAHDFNTSENYSQRRSDKTRHMEGLRKIRIPKEPPFYSEIVRGDGLIESFRGFYTLFDASIMGKAKSPLDN